MKQIEVLWLVEHIAREMDVACAVKCLVKSRYGIDIKIRHIYLHANEVMSEYFPLVVVHPFFYYVPGALATEDYVRTWPQSIHFNLAWEEIFYKAHVKIKAPADKFTKKRVIHHAWGNFYKDYLVENGVPIEHIFLNGNPAYQLYRSPYKQYYKGRGWLSQKYKLDGSSRWIFIPENYRWAFVSESKISRLVKEGSELNELVNLREFCRASLVQLLRWANEAAQNRELKIIFRPRPATNSQLIQKFFEQNVGCASANLHFIKGESVRDWILASDVIISSYSTSLIEAAIANKPIYMAEPIPFPESLYCDWYRYVTRLHSVQELEEACLKNNDVGNASALRTWAQADMLSNGDPIARLADFISCLVEEGKGLCINEGIPTVGKGIKIGIRKFFFRKNGYFNRDTHENDIFTEEDVERNVSAWHEVLVN